MLFMFPVDFRRYFLDLLKTLRWFNSSFVSFVFPFAALRENKNPPQLTDETGLPYRNSPAYFHSNY